jgi:hypothetical protein
MPCSDFLCTLFVALLIDQVVCDQEWQSQFRRRLVFKGCDKRWTPSQHQANKNLWREQATSYEHADLLLGG